MNEDILKGTWLEIKGSVKEELAKLTHNDLGEIEGKIEKLLGILQKKHGYIRNKAELEYKDTVALAEIVSRIREIMKNEGNIMAIAFIARHSHPLLTKNQESERKGNKEIHGDDTDRYFDSRLSRRNTPLILH
jgi:uncharacterized protein YjbJ (UPF0337 family)